MRPSQKGSVTGTAAAEAAVLWGRWRCGCGGVRSMLSEMVDKCTVRTSFGFISAEPSPTIHMETRSGVVCESLLFLRFLQDRG